VRFLGTDAGTHPAAVLIGVPFDATSTFRAGSRHGPGAIRWGSQSIETYSPVLRCDLEDISFADDGDLDVGGMTPEAMVDTLAMRIETLAATTLPVILGGEHTVTLGAVRALAGRHRDLAVLQLDAHTDLRNEYEGRRVSHATVMRRILEIVAPESVVAVGIRAGTREEFLLSTGLRYSAQRLAIPPEIWTWLEGRPVYITIDIDIMDPADAPGTGNPEPEGVSARDLLTFVRRLGGLRVVGVDLVEVSPPYDPSGRTSVLAATILREAVLAITAPRPA
jgi:agmatinase